MFRHSFFELSIKLGSVDVEVEQEIDDLIDFGVKLLSLYKHHTEIETYLSDSIRQFVSTGIVRSH
jgi:hypothetical protein